MNNSRDNNISNTTNINASTNLTHEFHTSNTNKPEDHENEEKSQGDKEREQGRVKGCERPDESPTKSTDDLLFERNRFD